MTTTQYDHAFVKATAKYLSGTDWRLVKAQAMAESALKPDAESPVGAMGLMQIMPGTWNDIKKELNFSKDANPFDPLLSIEAGAYYMSKLVKSWSSPRPDIDRYCLALASYNAGFGNLIKAQKKADGAFDYRSIIRKLPDITGTHSAETIAYVRRILSYYNQLVTG